MISVSQLNTVSAVCFTLSLLVRYARRRPRIKGHRPVGSTLRLGESVRSGPITIGETR
jgi:hypothetical protein